MLQFILGLIWTAEDIEHRTDINTDIPLEIDNLFDTDLHITIDIGLEGSRVGYNNAREVE